MHWPQIKERCPSARFVGLAKLPDHRLAFTRKSVKRGCGVADVVSDLGQHTWGVVFEINDLDVGFLDQSEGYCPGRNENSYWRRESMVFIDGNDEHPLTAHTYFAQAQPNPPLPNQAYKELILSAAMHWRLPAEYIAQLNAIEVRG